MSNFIIQKTVSGNFYHIYNNARTKVNVSDFDVVLDDVALTFIIQCKNGSNIPSQAVSIGLIQVIDLSVGTSPIPFSGIDELILLLKSISYTPYLQSLIITQPIRIYEVGQVGVFTMTPTQFTDNFTSTGLGRNTMLGWALRNGNNGTKNQQGKFSLNKGASPYDVIGAIGGEAKHTLISSELPQLVATVATTGGGTGGSDDQPARGTGGESVVNYPITFTQPEFGLGHNNMPPYLIDVWVERVTELVFYGASGGSGGAVNSVNGQTGDVYIPLDYLPLAGGTMDANANIFFANGSKISEGIVDAGTGGNKGIALTCAVGYEWKFEAGEAYLTNLSGNFITIKDYARSLPTVNDDITKGYVAGSYWRIDSQFYNCLDASEGAAVWARALNVPSLPQTIEVSGRQIKNIFTTDTEQCPAGVYTFVLEDAWSYLYFIGNTPIDAVIPDDLFDYQKGVELQGDLLTGANVTMKFNGAVDSVPIVTATSDIRFNANQVEANRWNFGLSTDSLAIGGATDLDYTASPTNGKVTSSTGTDATLPLADGTNAGLLKPSKYTLLESITEAFTTALKTAYDGAVTWISTNGANVLSHLSNTSNPHSTTAAQVGAPSGSGTSTGTNTGDNATNTQYSGLAASKEDTSNKQTDLTASATKFPTVNAVNTGLALKQDVATLLVDSIDKAILRNNYFWFTPNTVTAAQTATFGYSERLGSTFVLLLNGVLTRGMVLFSTTAIAGTIASMRQNNALQLQGYECKFTRKIQFNSNVSGQRFFCGISKGNQFAVVTNVEPNTLTDIVGVCQLSTSTNMHIVYNDAAGTATTVDLGSNYPCTDSQYSYYISVEQTTTSYIVTVERVTVATGASISTSTTTSTNIPNYATGVIQLLTFITNNATAAAASYLDGGGIGYFKN